MTHTSRRLIGWLIALLLIVAGFYCLHYLFYSSSPNPNKLSQALGSLVRSKINGDDAMALAQYQQIQADPDKTTEDKALSEVYIAGTEFSLTGNSSSRLQEVQKMKEIVNDTTLSAAVRAAAMSILGNEYTVSGGDPAVFAEIYKDAPFSSYLVPGDPQLSAMNLEKESYAIKPSSVAAIKVAVLASGKYFVDTKQSASTTAAYIATAVDYLNKADSAALDEAKAASPVSFTSSDRYILFSFARALTIGRLAIEKGEPFKSEYRNEFENFIAFAQSRKSTLADDEMLHARFQYAIILAADKDTAGEKAQLDLLARGMNGLSNPNASTFVVSVRNAHAYRPTGTSWSNIQKMFAVSPDFKVAVEKVLSGSAVTPT